MDEFGLVGTSGLPASSSMLDGVAAHSSAAAHGAYPAGLLPNNATNSVQTGIAPLSPVPAGPLDLSIDFTRPDSQRTRPLLIDGKRLYVDEHYISVWSPILRAWCLECPDRELILANVQYDHVLEMLTAIHPTYKDVDEQTVHVLLPLAFDYQMEGLLHRCECFLIGHKLPFLEKVWLADRPSHRLDLSGTRYYGLSDRVKVLLLERMHGSPPPDELPEPPVDTDHFLTASDLNFASVRAKTGRSYNVNPYYVAAWSAVFQERLFSLNSTDDIYCPCTHEELKFFLMAICPPQLRITESNIGPILMAACKMESQGLLRKCAQILLTPQTHLSVFVRLSLLDRCKLQDLLTECLQMIDKPEQIIEMSQQQTYDCLSVRARAELMDRFSVLSQQHNFQSHKCFRCKAQSLCHEVTWACPSCKSYSSEAPRQQATVHANLPAVPNQQQHAGGSVSPRHTQQYAAATTGRPLNQTPHSQNASNHTKSGTTPQPTTALQHR
ncbi:BTB/POZ-like domain and BTB/POZ fold domain and BTB/POZ domain-containing protein [Aphelenchoides fujianensis]|nr:BTB/POZ-like domain and BTB/POZ fold domain and BTB/POZ domain-containing protein [Aphelenchoides fujianensis]